MAACGFQFMRPGKPQRDGFGFMGRQTLNREFGQQTPFFNPAQAQVRQIIIPQQLVFQSPKLSTSISHFSNFCAQQFLRPARRPAAGQP